MDPIQTAFFQNVCLENKDVGVVDVIVVAKGSVSGMLWHSGLNSNFVNDLSKCTVQSVDTPVTKEEDASINYHMVSQNHKNST